jgi:helix-turn-helix protein
MRIARRFGLFYFRFGVFLACNRIVQARRAMQEEMIKATDAARILGVARQTLAGWRARHIGPPYVALTARSLRYKRSDLTAFIQAREVAPESIQAGDSPSLNPESEGTKMPPPFSRQFICGYR